MTSANQGNEQGWLAAQSEATRLLQSLLRVDTTNPPGRERAAALVLQRVLGEDGLDCQILEAEPERSNLICRLRSGSHEEPLLLTGHLDVVAAGETTRWTHPPFSGALADGMIWGRGAVDMKNMVAMSAMVVKLLKRWQVPLRRDVIFAAVADEEMGCDLGSRWLVEKHPDLVRAGYALGEIGGFPQRIGKKSALIVQTGEKGVAWLRMRARGTAGHGSMPRRDNAIIRLARATARLDKRLPFHLTPIIGAFVAGAAKLQPLPQRAVMSQILSEHLSPLILDRLLPDRDQAELFHALLRNTVSPTVLRGGEKTNVIPDDVCVELDGRTLPGYSADVLISELTAIVSDSEIAFEVIKEHAGVLNHPPDSELWSAICEIGGARSGLPVLPYMMPGFSDAQSFARLGTRWYGFSPIWFDPAGELRFSQLFHGYDERIPEAGYHWGLRTLYAVVERFCRR